MRGPDFGELIIGSALSSTMNEDISFIRKHVESTQVDVDAENRQLIANWLTPLDFKARQQDIFSRRQEGTGQWLLDSPEFQTWLTEPGQVLYCFGMRMYTYERDQGVLLTFHSWGW